MRLLLDALIFVAFIVAFFALEWFVLVLCGAALWLVTVQGQFTIWIIAIILSSLIVLLNKNY